MNTSEQKLVGRVLVKPGHKLWKLDMVSKEITPAERNVKSVTMNKFELFCSALNKKSAEKRFIKMLTAFNTRTP